MKILNTRTLIICVLTLSVAAILPSCKKKEGCTDPNSLNYDPDAEKDDGSCTYKGDDGTPSYVVPTEYSFSNVNYGGQTVRLLLLKDLVTKINAATSTVVTASELNAIYENTNGAHATIATNKKLSDKVADQATKDSIQLWFSQIETLSASNTFVRADGVDLKQMVEKTLMGAVFYYRAVNDYLNQVAVKDNNTVVAGQGTSMEHAWDEAFGYLGAPRDYNRYSDAEVISPGQKDSNGDGIFDSQSEKVFYYASTAAKRDDNTKAMASPTNFTKNLFDAFLKGRAAITNKDYFVRDNASAAVKAEWDRVIAATVLHYINEVKADIANSSVDLNKHWAELKGYAGMIRHNSSNMLGSTNIAALQGYIGNKPADASLGDLDAATTLIQNAYGFSSEQASGM